MDIQRYQRQLSLIGLEGQQHLTDSSVCIIGCGGVGSPLSLYLTSAGVGHIGLVDDDVVDLSNLQRQILYQEDQLGQLKVEVGRENLLKLNEAVSIETYAQRLDAASAEAIFPAFDLIVDGSDNFRTRYLVNDVCCHLGIPFVSASVLRYQAQLLFSDGQQGCYRCLYPEPPPGHMIPNCAEAGVLGAVVGVIGAVAANIVINYLAGDQQPTNEMLLYDGQQLTMQKYAFRQNSNCPACVQKKLTELHDDPLRDYAISPSDLTGYHIVDVRADWERQLGKLDDHQHIPLQTLLISSNVIISNQGKPILFYCKTGYRSNIAANYYQQYTDQAYSLAGGFGSISHNG